MTRYPVTPHPFQSPKSFYDIGTGAETLKLRPEWEKERDMGHTPTPWTVDEVRTQVGRAFRIGAGDMLKSGKGCCIVYDDYPGNPDNERAANAAYIVECVNSHASLVEEVERLREALTPSGETKAAYMGEFSIGFPDVDENGIEYTRKINVPWTTIKEIMAAIRERANA